MQGMMEEFQRIYAQVDLDAVREMSGRSRQSLRQRPALCVWSKRMHTAMGQERLRRH